MTTRMISEHEDIALKMKFGGGDDTQVYNSLPETWGKRTDTAAIRGGVTTWNTVRHLSKDRQNEHSDKSEYSKYYS